MEPKKNKTSNKQTALKQNINSHILKHATYHIRSNNSSTVSSAAENLPLEHLWSITEERERTPVQHHVLKKLNGNPLSLYFLHTTKLGLDWDVSSALKNRCKWTRGMEFRHTKCLEKSCIRHQKVVCCFTGRSSYYVLIKHYKVKTFSKSSWND